MKLNKKFLLFLIPLFIIGFVFYQIQNSGVPATTTKVRKGTIKQTISASGEIGSDQVASLSFPLGAQISKILVKESDFVKKSQVLIKGNSVSEYNSYIQSQSALDQAKSNLETFKEQYKTNPDAIGVYNEAIYWEKYNYYQKGVESAQNGLNISAKSLGDKLIYAPFDGIITKINYKENEQASAGSPVIVISNPSNLYFLAEIDEGDFGKLENNQNAQISLDSFPQETFLGGVSNLPKFATKNATGNTIFEVKIKLPENLLSKSAIGMHGDIEITTKEKSQILFLDSTAIVKEEGAAFVYLVESKKAKKQSVQVGLETDLDTEIISGVSENQIVVFPKNGIIKDGTKVKI
jgi:macrolide-specific efflux system membrane fusion protein